MFTVHENAKVIDQKTIDRFFSYIQFDNEDQCWMWNGYRKSNGKSTIYGYFSVNKVIQAILNISSGDYRSHRFVYILYNGHIPARKDVVRHKCDNMLCCNPKHLIIGTHADNVRDRVERCRGAVGTNINTSKLIDDQVREIKIRIKQGDDINHLAREFKVDRKTIAQIRDNVTWKHIVIDEQPVCCTTDYVQLMLFE